MIVDSFIDALVSVNCFLLEVQVLLLDLLQGFSLDIEFFFYALGLLFAFNLLLQQLLAFVTVEFSDLVEVLLQSNILHLGVLVVDLQRWVDEGVAELAAHQV